MCSVIPRRCDALANLQELRFRIKIDSATEYVLIVGVASKNSGGKSAENDAPPIGSL